MPKKPKTTKADPLVLLRAHGQLDSADLAGQCGLAERELHARLYPAIVAGDILQCSLSRAGKPAGHQYRWSGWTPPRTAGAPSAAARARAAELEEEPE
jgi:hypothetical protein